MRSSAHKVRRDTLNGGFVVQMGSVYLFNGMTVRVESVYSSYGSKLISFVCLLSGYCSTVLYSSFVNKALLSADSVIQTTAKD